MKIAYGTEAAARVGRIVLPDGGAAREFWGGGVKVYPSGESPSPVSPYLQDSFHLALGVPSVGDEQHRFWASFYSVFLHGFQEQYFGASPTYNCWDGNFNFSLSLPVLRKDGTATYFTFNSLSAIRTYGLGLYASGLLYVPARFISALDASGYAFSRSDLLSRPVLFHIWGQRSFSVYTAISLANTHLAYNSLNVLPEPVASCISAVSVGTDNVSGSLTLLASVLGSEGVYNAPILSLFCGSVGSSVSSYDGWYYGRVDGCARCVVKNPLPYNTAGFSLQALTPLYGNNHFSLSVAPDYSRSYPVLAVY